MVTRWNEWLPRRIVGSIALFALLGALMPCPRLICDALALSGATLDDVRFDFTAGEYEKALAGANSLIGDGKVTGAELANCLAFKGRSLVHLGREEEAVRALRDAHKADPGLKPDDSWSPEELRAYAAALKAKPFYKRPLTWVLGAGAAVGLAALLGGGGGASAAASDLPVPPDLPGTKH